MSQNIPKTQLRKTKQNGLRNSVNQPSFLEQKKYVQSQFSTKYMMINYNQIVESRKNSQLKSSRLSKDSVSTV